MYKKNKIVLLIAATFIFFISQTAFACEDLPGECIVIIGDPGDTGGSGGGWGAGDAGGPGGQGGNGGDGGGGPGPGDNGQSKEECLAESASDLNLCISIADVAYYVQLAYCAASLSEIPPALAGCVAVASTIWTGIKYVCNEDNIEENLRCNTL